MARVRVWFSIKARDIIRTVAGMELRLGLVLSQ
jgi:hypothetical protein